MELIKKGWWAAKMRWENCPPVSGDKVDKENISP
jgi:hypothetical protein